VRSVLERRQAVLDSLLLPESIAFDSSGTDSLAATLDRGGAAAVQARRKSESKQHRALFDLGLQPLALTTYQRVDGFRLGAGLAPSYGHYLRADGAGAYGFSSNRWSSRAGLEIGRSRGPVLRFAWSDVAEPFGTYGEGRSLGMLALVAGQDRRDYLRRRGVQVEAWAWRGRARSLGVRYFDRKESTLAARTDYHFFGGGTPMQEPNPVMDDGRARGIVFEGRLGAPRARTSIAGEFGFLGGAAGGDFEANWQRIGIGLRQPVTGGVLSLFLEGMHAGGSPPSQMAAYLGSDATLRAYDRLEFSGRERASTRIEYELGLDLLRRSQIPGVERLKIQFIPFFDVGSTWVVTRSVERSRGSLEGDPRSGVGLGLQRTLWFPGLEVVRFDISARTDGGDDRWGFWFRVLSIGDVTGDEDEW
jgi:hypothetical protein